MMKYIKISESSLIRVRQDIDDFWKQLLIPENNDSEQNSIVKVNQPLRELHNLHLPKVKNYKNNFIKFSNLKEHFFLLKFYNWSFHHIYLLYERKGIEILGHYLSEER